MANAATSTTHATSYLSLAFICCMCLILSSFSLVMVHSISATLLFNSPLSSASLVITLLALPSESSSNHLTKAQAPFPWEIMVLNIIMRHQASGAMGVNCTNIGANLKGATQKPSAYVESLPAHPSSGSVPIDTTNISVLLSGTKLWIKILWRKSKIRRFINFLNVDPFRKDD